MSTLEARLLNAHMRRDRAALVALYQEAADSAEPAARPFFLTQAYVYALETGHADVDTLRARLVAMGCEPA
ncbi:MAG: hypothetical protein AAF227_05740 [Pseudomonadota bacterium]